MSSAGRSISGVAFRAPAQLRTARVPRSQRSYGWASTVPWRQLRATVVTETYPPELNGAAMTVGRLTEALVERGHHVELVRPRQAGEGSASNHRGVSLRLVPGLPIPLYRALRFGPPRTSMFLRAWAFDRPDLVHVATEGPLGASALRAARRCGIPVSTSFHTNFHRYLRHYGLAWLGYPATWYLRRFHNRAACTFVPTRQAREELRAQGFRNLVLLGRGVDVSRFSPARRSAALRRSWGASESDPVLLYVGRLAPEKNLPLAVDAFRAARASHPGARFVLVGDGPLERELRRAHPEFVFAGRRCAEDLAAHYASADVFVFPSLTETFGNVTLEAMASGLAVLAFADAAAGELIHHEQNGLLVPRGDPARFVDEARRVVQEPGLVAHMRLNAADTAATRSWEAVGDEFENVLMDLANEPSRWR